MSLLQTMVWIGSLITPMGPMLQVCIRLIPVFPLTPVYHTVKDIARCQPILTTLLSTEFLGGNDMMRQEELKWNSNFHWKMEIIWSIFI